MYCTVIHYGAYEEDSFIDKLSSSQSEYFTHWEKTLCFTMSKCYDFINLSQWYFSIIYACDLLSMPSIILKSVFDDVYEF
jgi:hypothetical protein